MDFAGALAYLDEHINLEAAPGGPKAGDVHGLSLDRMRGMIDVLGDPQASAPAIHITGTNGKGSVARMVTALLSAHGLTVGTYASPHLESITERIRRNADNITEAEFAGVVGEVAALEPLFPERPSYFDLLTASAFSWFAQEAVEVMVVEVGMLGRFDSTNVVDADVAVITNVGFDHTDGTGDWREAITWEKAGIIKDGSRVIIGETAPALVEIMMAEGGASHWIRDQDFGAAGTAIALGGRQFDAYTPSSRHEGLFVPLHGAHQVANAAVAIAAVEAFFDRDVDRGVIDEALAAVEAPGRFEVVAHGPLTILDMAHNPPGAAAVAHTFTEEFTVGGDLILVVGMLSGRDPAQTLAPLIELAPAEMICVAAESPRAVPARELATVAESLLQATGRRAVVTAPEHVEVAVNGAMDRAGDQGAVLVTGSTYVVGEARTALRKGGVIRGPGTGDGNGSA